jgi:FkbM family methyltransferase
MYYSQLGEDKLLNEKYFKNKRDGFFIELGAMDGITYSNTLFFEQQFGWTGVLIEPQKSMYDLLINNRPNCYNFNYAISEVEGDTLFRGSHALGGIDSTMTEQHKTSWNLTETYFVKSKPMKDILKDLSIKEIDLFSVDVEGGELEVLKTFDWDIYVNIILVEMHGIDLEKDNEIRNFLKEKDFQFSENVPCSEIWVNRRSEYGNISCY